MMGDVVDCRLDCRGWKPTSAPGWNVMISLAWYSAVLISWLLISLKISLVCYVAWPSRAVLFVERDGGTEQCVHSIARHDV